MVKETRARLSRFNERARVFQEDFFNLNKLNLPKVDIVVSMLAIHHFENKIPLYEAIYKIVSANNGVFILSDLVVDPRKNQEVYQFRKNHMASKGMSEKKLRSGFKFLTKKTDHLQFKKIWNI